MYNIFQNNQYPGRYYFTTSGDDPVFQKYFDINIEKINILSHKFQIIQTDCWLNQLLWYRCKSINTASNPYKNDEKSDIYLL